MIPEIDWTLNEAQELFVKLIAEPRVRNYLGFEIGQRSTDDIKSIVVPSFEIPVVDNIATLPNNYWYYINSKAYMNKGTCTDIKGDVYIRQNNDNFQSSPFDSSSFEWRTVNGVFNERGIQLFAEDFTITRLAVTYIRKLAYIHNAEGFRGGQYNLPSGLTLSGSQSCELPEHTHKEIVDIAVLLASGELQNPDYSIKRDKLTINQIN